MIKKRRIRDITSFMFKNWKTWLLIITFDVLFILVISSMRFVQISIDNVFFSLFTNKIAGKIYSILFVVLGLFWVILTYSFFKYFIVKFICEPFNKVKFKLKEFLTFLKLNLSIFMPLTILVISILDLIIISLNNWMAIGGIDPFNFAFIILAGGILALIVIVIIYNFINIVHFAFFKEQHIGRLLKKGVTNSFRIKSYGMYWNNLKVILISGVLLLIVHLLVKSFIFNDFSYYVKNVGRYKMFIYGMITLILYFILLFNRLNFCIGMLNVSEKDLLSVYNGQEKKEKGD